MREFLETWKKYFVFAALLSCFINILQLTFSFYMFAIYQSIVTSYSHSSLVTITIMALYALVVLVFFNYLRIKLLNTAGVALDEHVGDTVLKHILKAQDGSGRRTYQQGISDLDMIRNYFNNPGIYALFDAPWAPLYLLIIYSFHPVLGIVATVGALLIFGLSVLQDALTRNRLAAANMRNYKNRQLIDIVLRNAEVVNSMGMQHDICNRCQKANEDVITDQTVASRYAGILQSITKPMQVFMQILMYGIGAYYALAGQFDAGMMVAASIIMGQAVGPLMRTMSTWRFTLQVKGAYGRLSQFLDLIEKQPAKMRLPKPKGKIEGEHLFLKIGNAILLRDVSFALEPGELLGVIGPSGAGKSTLCRLILGIWPSLKGKIRLDDVDLFYWDQEELGDHIGYLSQEVDLFETSIAKNIARMGAVDEDEVRKAAKAVLIDEWIESLPDGYATVLGAEGGISPSGGQKQRIGLARAMYGNPSLIILDEPNSNLDDDGDKALMHLLTQIRQQQAATCIIVTHKPDILQAVDKILVLKDGQSVSFGERDQVFQSLMSDSQMQRQAV